MSSSSRQRVVIPAGVLCHDKNNVIEIPQAASVSNIIVATKPRGGDSNCDTECPAGKTSTSRQTSNRQWSTRQSPAASQNLSTSARARPQRSQRSATTSRRPVSFPESQGSTREPSGDHSVTTVGPELDELEHREQRNFKEDLKEFQEARKKLFTDILTLQIAKLQEQKSANE